MKIGSLERVDAVVDMVRPEMWERKDNVSGKRAHPMLREDMIAKMAHSALRDGCRGPVSGSGG